MTSSSSPQIILICANAYQAGWLQTHDARIALERLGARPSAVDTGQWILPNGIIIQFCSVHSHSLPALLQSICLRGTVITLYQAHRLEEWEYEQLYAQLRALAEHQRVQLLDYSALSPALQMMLGIDRVAAQLADRSTSENLDNIADQETIPLRALTKKPE